MISILSLCVFYFFSFCVAENEKDPRHASSKCSMDMRQTLSKLEKNTRKFVKEHNNLSSKVEYMKFKSYAEERKSLRAGSGKLFFQRRYLDFRSLLNCCGFFHFFFSKIRGIIRTASERNCVVRCRNYKRPRIISYVNMMCWQIGPNIWSIGTFSNNAKNIWMGKNESHFEINMQIFCSCFKIIEIISAYHFVCWCISTYCIDTLQKWKNKEQTNIHNIIAVSMAANENEWDG